MLQYKHLDCLTIFEHPVNPVMSRINKVCKLWNSTRGTSSVHCTVLQHNKILSRLNLGIGIIKKENQFPCHLPEKNEQNVYANAHKVLFFLFFKDGANTKLLNEILLHSFITNSPTVLVAICFFRRFHTVSAI